MNNFEFKAYEAIDENDKVCWVVIAPGRNKVFSNFEKFKNYLIQLEGDGYFCSQELKDWLLRISNDYYVEVNNRLN